MTPRHIAKVPTLPARLLALHDIHTHRQADSSKALISLLPEDAEAYAAEHPGCLFSVGIHPWEMSVSTAEEERRFAALEKALRLEAASAVGETGLDATRGPEIRLQLERFRRHIALSETLGLPLIIHLVKAQEQLLALRKELRPEQPWIIHGFRGKAEQARQLATAGMYISFGERFNPEALAAVPDSQRLAETDESQLPIHDIRTLHSKALSAIQAGHPRETSSM